MSFSGPEVNDALNKIVILTAKKYGVDIRPLFDVLNLDERFVYLSEPYLSDMKEGEVKEIAKSLNDLPKINPNARYIDETYHKNPTGSIAGAKANITSIEAKGEANKLHIELQDGDADNLLGYRVYRTNAGVPLAESSDLIGYAKAGKDGKTVFADTLSVSNYLFDYYVVPIGKNLEDATMSDKFTTKGNPQEQKDIEISELSYNQFVDVLSVKGKGYKESSTEGNTNYMQLVINGRTYDTSALNAVINPNTVTDESNGEKNKNFISFYPQQDGTWEMRIKGFSLIGENEDLLDVTANLVENYFVDLSEVDKTEERQRIIAQSVPVLRNLGDIFVDGSTSPLLKSIEIDGIKGEVDQKFDPLLDTYTEERKFIKSSLSEIDPSKTILMEPTEELTIKLNPADEHATYKMYATQTTYVYPTPDSPEVEITTGNRLEMENGVSPDAKDPDLWAYDQDLTNDYIYVKVGTQAAANNDKFVRIQGTARSTQATWSVYHRYENSILNEEIKVDRNDNYYTKLSTEQFRNGTDICIGVVAQDGVTLKEYPFVTELSEEAKNSANLRDIEISGQANKNVGYVKGFTKLDTSGLASYVKDLYEKPENKYEGIYKIAPTTADTTKEDEIEMVSLTIRPIVDFYTSDQDSSPEITWDWWSFGSRQSYPINLKDAPASLSLTEYNLNVKKRPDELKKLNMHEASQVGGGLDTGVINFVDPAKYLRLR